MNWSYSGPYFPALGLNTAGYSVSSGIQSECGKKRVRISLDTDTFCAVVPVQSNFGMVSVMCQRPFWLVQKA